MKNPSPKWCNRKPCSNPGRCEWIGSCYRTSEPKPNPKMKTIPMEEALKLATKGPLAPSSDPRRYPAVISESGTWVAKTDCSINSDDWASSDPIAEANAALLAHFYNHGPALVEFLRLYVAEGECYCADNVACKDPCGTCAGKTLLAKASTVQMP